MTKLLVFITLFHLPALSALIIPSNMSKEDREKMVSILSPGTMMKVLGDPYPLGGYSGVEVGLGGHLIDTKSISTLGDTASPQSEISYLTVSVFKGLFYNLDIGVEFAPLEQPEGISYFSGQVRWGIHQSRRLPLYWTIILSLGGGAFQGVGINSQEISLVGGFRERDVVLFAGTGYFQGQGLFPSGIRESVNATHYLVGLSVDVGSAFVSLELDQYDQAQYSAKLGTRF